MPWIPFLHPFCSHGNNFVFSWCLYNSSAKIPVSNFQIRGRQVIGLKFDTKFFSNHPFRKVILLEASIQLKCYTVVQVVQVFDLVSRHTMRFWAFQIRHFSYLLLYFLNFNVYVVLYCQLSQLILHLPQPIFVFFVRHCSVPYITSKTSTFLCIFYHTFCLCSFQFVE